MRQFLAVQLVAMSHQEERDAILGTHTHDVFVHLIDRLLAVESELDAAKERLDRVEYSLYDDCAGDDE